MKTEPVKIHLKERAQPYAAMTACRIPFPLMDKVEAELSRLENNGVIVAMSEPSEWCSPIVPVLKKKGQVRITVDYKRLNASVKRQPFMLPNLADITPKLAGATVFSSLDAASGSYQIPLNDSSSKLTTFVTPFGRFRFQRIPMGIKSAPEVFQQKWQNYFRTMQGVRSLWIIC